MFRNEWILASPHSWPVSLEHPRTILVFLKKVWGVFKAHIGLEPDWQQIGSHHHPNLLNNPSCLKQQHVFAMLLKTKESEKPSRQSYEQIGFWRLCDEFFCDGIKDLQRSLITHQLPPVWQNVRTLARMKALQVGITRAQRGLLRHQV